MDAEVTFWLESPILHTMMYSPHGKAQAPQQIQPAAPLLFLSKKKKKKSTCNNCFFSD